MIVIVSGDLQIGIDTSIFYGEKVQETDSSTGNCYLVCFPSFKKAWSWNMVLQVNIRLSIVLLILGCLTLKCRSPSLCCCIGTVAKIL